MIKTLVLIRHAHRDVESDVSDDGLSARGETQARALRNFALARGLGGPQTRLVASPKQRARETLALLAAQDQRPVEIDPLLNERQTSESSASLAARVHLFLDAWHRSSARLTFACTHGDWLPLASARLLGQCPELPNAAWLEVEAYANEITLKCFVPGFDWWP